MNLNDKPTKREQMVTAARYIMCGMTYSQVASLVGVSPSTVRNWTRRKDWSEIMQDASSVEFTEMAAKALGVVKNAIEDGDLKTATWYLSKVHPVFSGRKASHVDESGPTLAAHEKVKALDTESLRRLARGDEDVDPDVLDLEFMDDE